MFWRLKKACEWDDLLKSGTCHGIFVTFQGKELVFKVQRLSESPWVSLER